MKTTNFWRLANISPLDLTRFREELIRVFIEETGITSSSPVCTALMTLPNRRAWAKIDWNTVFSSLQDTKLNEDKLLSFRQHVQVLVDRMVIYEPITRAISGTELVRQEAYRLPDQYPVE